jgi:large repetitive protein
MKRVLPLVNLFIVLLLAACGGGGGNGGSPPPPPPPANITITSNAQLPNALQGQPYTTTLAAANGQGALKWSMGPSNAVYPTGLTIDSTTGIVSGTANFQGGAGFIATVTDANNRTATKTFSLGGYGVLSSGNPMSLNAYQYQVFYYVGGLPIQGGVPPLKFTLVSGSLPFGVKIDSTGQIQGAAVQSGTFSAVINVTDSWTQPQSVNQALNISVTGAPLSAWNNFPNSYPINQPANFAVFPTGGTPPYSFNLASGSLPTGVALDQATGKFTGTPTAMTSGNASVQVTDSVGAKTFSYLYYSVVAPKGRNDSIQTATLFQSNVSASLSPYLDPPDKAPLAADSDYYKLVSMAGSTIHLSMQAQGGNIDPVIEVLDANGIRFSTCNSVDYTATNYSSPCINDEDGQSAHNSALDYKVPGNPGDIVNSYVHAFDWSGNARPDMYYYLAQNGAVQPLNLQLTAARTFPYSYSISMPYIFNGTWSLDSGTIPDGLSISATGVISGTPTTAGAYSFRLKVLDPHTSVVDYVYVTMQIYDPVKITSSATLPTVCVNQYFTFTATTSGGTPPFYWNLNYSNWPFFFNPTNGVISGSTSTAGNFTTTISVIDGSGSSDAQNISLTVQNCP